MGWGNTPALLKPSTARVKTDNIGAISNLQQSSKSDIEISAGWLFGHCMTHMLKSFMTHVNDLCELALGSLANNFRFRNAFAGAASWSKYSIPTAKISNVNHVKECHALIL
jgi:hypothetical protein